MTTLEIVITGVVPLGRFATRLKLQPRANATGETYGRPIIFHQKRISHFLTTASSPIRERWNYGQAGKRTLPARDFLMKL